MNICSCLLALVLGWNAAAEIIHEIVEVKTSVSLRCPHSVEGIVTWSRESNGSKVDILTTGHGDTDIKHIDDRGKRYSSLLDKSLRIHRVTVSDSGRYFCNSEAVELTVIPPGTRLHATEGTRVTLTCPPDVGGSDVKKWSSRNIDDIKHQTGFYASPVNHTLTITYVKLKHSGLYYCDGKPAAYLNVTKGQTTTSTTTTTPKTRPTSVPSTTPLTNEDTTSTTKGNKTTTSSTPTTTTRQTTATTTATTTTTTQTVPSTTPLTNEDTTSTTKRHKKKDRKNKNTKDPTLGLVFGIVAFLLLVIIIIIVVYFAWRRRIERRGRAEICHVYEEIDRVVFQPTNGGGSLAGTTASYCMTDFQDGSHHNDPMYSTIPDLPRVEKKSETSLPNDSTYSLIGNPLSGGIDKGSSQIPENAYFLLEKPK